MLPVPRTLNETVEMTLCAKEEGKDYHNLKHIERTCEDCGVDKFSLLPKESSDNGLVKWSRYKCPYGEISTRRHREEDHTCAEGDATIADVQVFH